MAETLLSVGLDVGTTSTQLVVSELTVENQASAFAVPELTISERKILYESPVYFTPLLGESRVDGDGVRRIVEEEYRKAGICRDRVDTGAVIITGETSRKENARAVLGALSEFAGDFVVATAGPALESVLAAKGAGAVAESQRTGKTVLHMDIGGGTANLALVENGKITATGCMNVGGRLVKFDENRRITYVSPVLRGLWEGRPGDLAAPETLEPVCRILVRALEAAAGLREDAELLQRLGTEEAGRLPPVIPQSGEKEISFSGGVADCIETEFPWQEFGDLGPLLGRAIRESRLCAGAYRLGSQTIRATVIGAGCHSAQLTGSTVFCRDVAFPLKNRPVVCLSEREQVLPEAALAERIRSLLAQQDSEAVLALPGFAAPGYDRVKALARGIRRGMRGQRILVALEQDMAKALGQAICLEGPEGTPCLCIDRVRLSQGAFLDVGAPVGPALPVVVKTLVLQQ